MSNKVKYSKSIIIRIIIMLIVILFGYYHSFKTKNILEIFSISFKLSIPLQAALLGPTLVDILNLAKFAKSLKNLYFDFFSGLIANLVSSFFFGFTIYCTYRTSLDFILWLKSPNLVQDYSVLLLAIFILSVGLILFYIRLNYKILYGITEISVGISIGVSKIFDTFQNEVIRSEFYFALITASLFLVVRGLDNIYQGLSKFHPLSNAFIELESETKKQLKLLMGIK